MSRSPRVGVKAFIVRDGHILMNHVVTDGGQHLYGPPGGGQEHGEDQVRALRRECREEIGADVEVHHLACLYEYIADRRLRDGAPIPLFHQVNLAYWCGLADGAEPGIGHEPDPNQVGCAWLPIDRLHEYAVRPVELIAWLQSDPGARPAAIGVTSQKVED